MLYLSRCKPISLILTPSMVILPSFSSESLNKACKIVLLPAPVRPTTPTFMPGCTVKLKFFIAGGRFGR